jgi:amidohydrolase
MGVDAKTGARERIETAREQLLDLSHRIHAQPELGMREVQACAWLSDALRDAGFAVERGSGGLETAFSARSGPGPFRVVVCAEYDALPGIGHACGHNIIAAMSLGAGLGLAAVADEVGVEVTVLGTPAEESGGGKIILLERGAFDGAHAAMMVHPSPFDVVEPPVIAVNQLNVQYFGKAAHAAAFPELGVNAADAMVVAQTAIGLLRQHLRATDRVHGIVTKGGDAPNVVPSHTEGTWLVRAHDLAELGEVEAKVMRCFEAGALATGSTLQVTPEHPPYAEMHHDPALASLYRANAEALGRTFLDFGSIERTAGSTDMGNVSLAVPSIHPSIGIDSLPAVNHQPEFTAQCATPVADRAVVDGAIAMAWTVIDAAADDQLRTRLMEARRATG